MHTREMLIDWLLDQKAKYVGHFETDTRKEIGSVRLDGIFNFSELERYIIDFAKCQFEAGKLSTQGSLTVHYDVDTINVYPREDIED